LRRAPGIKVFLLLFLQKKKIFRDREARARGRDEGGAACDWVAGNQGGRGRFWDGRGHCLVAVGAPVLHNLLSLWVGWLAVEASGIMAIVMSVLAARDLILAEQYLHPRRGRRGRPGF
jgi:hypothetical protein